MTGVSGAETERSGAGQNLGGAERSGGRVSEKLCEAWAGGRRAGTERWAEVRKIRFNAERQNLPLRSAHMLCWPGDSSYQITLSVTAAASD